MITLLDGPLGSQLDARGGACDEQSWSAMASDSAPELVAAIHRDYAAAGATVHTANTFRSKRRNVGAIWQRLTARAVQIAKTSVPASHRIAGSIAPLADCYRPDLSPEQDTGPEHFELAEALVGAGVDILLCETFANPVEAVVAVHQAVRAGSESGIETWLALTAGPQADLMSPQAMAETALRAVDGGAAAVLVNCTPVNETLPFLEAIAAVKLGVPIGAYANSGQAAWQADDPAVVAEYVAAASDWIDLGATLVGGCCGTTPTHIARLNAIVCDA